MAAALARCRVHQFRQHEAVPFGHLGLLSSPPGRGQHFGMMFQEHLLELPRNGQKRQPLLREYIVRPVVEPGLGAGFLLFVARLREIAEHAIADEA